MPQVAWPKLDYAASRASVEALHLWCQIVGKYRLAHTPWLNHSWHATFYVTPRGLTTGPIYDDGEVVEVLFDFQAHELHVRALSRAHQSFPLEAMSVADFHGRFTSILSALKCNPAFHGIPNEIPNPVPFKDDRETRPYDRTQLERLHQALVRSDEVFKRFRTGFLGKCSPVHLFWGALDLAVTRFSGRTAPLHPGGIPSLPDAVTREAYSHEVSSAGFWPGGMGVEEAMFYSYLYPTNEAFTKAALIKGYYDGALGEFLLPYETVRAAADPAATLLQFLQQTYEAAAQSAGWNRQALECEQGKVGVPRPVSQSATGTAGTPGG